jgi:hypothetical protein
MATVDLALDLAMALDPVLLMLQAGLTPDPWQRDLLSSDARRQILLCARQVGKSTVVAAKALHVALYEPESLTLIVTPSERQSRETLAKVVTFYSALGEPVSREHESMLHLTLANGSRILALPGSAQTVRGMSGVALLILDEAGWIPDPLYHTVLPMLAVSQGRLVLLSTPAGKRGFLHQEWTEGGPDWQRIMITASECPRISPAFLAEQRRRMPAGRYASEYDCVFGDIEGAAFAYDDIHAAIHPDVLPLFERPTVAQEEGYAQPLW